MKKRLARETQCAKCPWRVDTDPNDIPNGYTAKAHRNLKHTIAVPGSLDFGDSINVMSCHETDGLHCIGWVANQFGSGNNIALRIKMMKYDLRGLTLRGEQHQCFEDTLPKDENERT